MLIIIFNNYFLPGHDSFVFITTQRAVKYAERKLLVSGQQIKLPFTPLPDKIRSIRIYKYGSMKFKQK